MNEQTKEQLLKATKPLIDADNWAEIERLWESFVRSGDIDAQGELASLYENYGFDEGAEKDRQMREMLRQFATNGHAGANFFLAITGPRSEESDQFLRKAAELGNVYAPGRSWRALCHRRLDRP